MVRFYGADFNGFFILVYYLVGVDVGWERRELRVSELWVSLGICGGGRGARWYFIYL